MDKTSVYKCSICNFISKSKYNYKRHLETNKHKKNKNEREQKEPRITTYNHVKPRITTEPKNEQLYTQKSTQKRAPPKMNKKHTDKNVIFCEYCNKNCSKKMFKRHLREYCIYIPENKRRSLIEKYNNDKRNKNKQLVIQNNENVITNQSTINNTINHNNFNINNGNIINNNITFKINPLGKEDLSFLTNEDKMQILQQQFMGVPELIKKIHTHPSNMNFYLPNVNKKIIAYLNEEDKLEYDNYNNICKQIIDDNIDRFDEIFNEIGNDLNKSIKSKIKKVIDINSNNKNINDKYIDDIKYNLLSWSKDFKTNLNNYVNKLTENLQLDIIDNEIESINDLNKLELKE